MTIAIKGSQKTAQVSRRGVLAGLSAGLGGMTFCLAFGSDGASLTAPSRS
jgi:hypothetical protein